MLFFFPRNVLNAIWDRIESVPEDLSYLLFPMVRSAVGNLHQNGVFVLALVTYNLEVIVVDILFFERFKCQKKKKKERQ